MTWAEHAQRSSRTPAWIVEVDLDWHDDPAIQPVNEDGTLCYRTPATTDQGPRAITRRTRRWQSATVRPMPGVAAIPCVQSVSIGSEEIRLGRGLSYFGQATIELNDFVDDDRRAEDPFTGHPSRNGLDPEAGTYLTKLMARNPYWTGRPIRLIAGWATGGIWHPDDIQTHVYFIRDVQGPSQGKLRLTAVGPLQQISLNEAEAPAPSEGRLAANLTSAATAASIHDPLIAEDYPASGFLRIGDEVVAFTRAGTVLSLTRAQLGTLADSHEADDALQLVLRYQTQPLTTILADLLTTYGHANPSLLDLPGWAIEQAEWLPAYNLSGTISTPTKVLDLIQELLEASGCVLWWDDAGGVLRLRAIRTVMPAQAAWGDALHLLGRPEVKRDMAERISRTDVLLDLRSAALDPKEASSYRLRLIGISYGEGPAEHGSAKPKLLASRWLAVNQVGLAGRAAYLISAQLRNGRTTITVEVSAKDAALRLGDVVTLISQDLIDRTGQPESMRCVIVRREPISTGGRYRYVLQPLPSFRRAAVITANDHPDYEHSTALQKEQWAYIAGNGPPWFPDGNQPYLITE
jgi:hypothetical protein